MSPPVRWQGSWCRGHVHLSMRGSCCRDWFRRSSQSTPCGVFSSFLRVHLLFAPCDANRRSPDDCASSLRSRNSEDGHVPYPLFSGSRRARLPGACVHKTILRRFCAHIRVRVLPSSAPALSRETSLGSHRSRSRPRALSRAHLFRVYRAHLSTITGNTHRFTVHGLARIRVTFRRVIASIFFFSKISPSPRTRQSRPP